MRRAGWQIVIPGFRVRSTANMREHWAAKHRRNKQEREAVAWRLCAVKRLIRPPITIKLVRYGPKKLDGDNLQSGLKAVRDEIALCLGVDDGDEASIAFEYSQERGPYALVICGEERAEA